MPLFVMSSAEPHDFKRLRIIIVVSLNFGIAASLARFPRKYASLKRLINPRMGGHFFAVLFFPHRAPDGAFLLHVRAAVICGSRLRSKSSKPALPAPSTALL